MDDDGPRAEQLITLSGGARRVADLVAAAAEPLRYEVVRHLLRVSEETMTEVLEEAVHARLVKRAENPFTYIPYNERVATDLREAIGPERLALLRTRIAAARARVED